MNRLSGLFWLATFLMLIAPSGSSGQAVPPRAIQIVASGWEWVQRATLSSSLGQYALDRHVTEPAVVRSLEPFFSIAPQANRPALSVEMRPGLSLTPPRDLIIELPRDVLTSLHTDCLPGQPQHGTGQVIVLIVPISKVYENAPAGRSLQCSPVTTEVWGHDKGLASARLPGEQRSRMKRGPTKSGNYAGP